MKDLILAITADEPLVITSGSAESMSHECLGHIPGNMLLGAMAAAWKRQHPGSVPDDNPEFRRLFLDGETSWGDAVPLCEGKAAVPIPLCYMYEKNHSALPPENTEFEPGEYWVCNTLALAGDQQVRELWQKSHPDEEIKLKKVGEGFMNPATLHRAIERRVFNVHVALGKARSALEGQLYGYSAIARGTKLQSRIICHTDGAAQALLALVEKVRSLHVGHARSAGYGHIRLAHEQAPGQNPQSEGREDFTLFLVSRYLPAPSWEEPLENLRRQLARLADCEARFTACYTSAEEVQGYNGLWNRPRDARVCLAQGSAARVHFARPVSLPKNFALGGGQIEGYGRMVCNPAFLEDALPAIAPGKAMVRAPRPVQAGNGPIWKLLRERATARQIGEQVTIWLHDPAWEKFLDSVARQSRPSASQRNNLRNANVAVFREMLDKTPGAQWNQAIAFCPFTKRRDHLSEIMLKLLDPETFGKTWHLSAPKLPGLPANTDESGKFAQKAHRLFVRQLISIWGKMSRLSEEKE